MWQFVIPRFTALLKNVGLTALQVQDGLTKQAGVRGCLNAHYWGITSDSAHSFRVGSWGKDTAVAPPRDIDVLFQLPYEVYQRFSQRGGNVQSQVLQEVKGIIESTYPRTEVKGDGPVVIVPFESYSVEVVPAFLLDDNTRYWVCDSSSGGRYKLSDPHAEIVAVQGSNTVSRGNTCDLIRMMKCWQRVRNVPLKSFAIELIGLDFLNIWKFRGNTIFWYDWMVRDFLEFLVDKAGSWVSVPGTGETIYLGDAWLSRAQTALSASVYACVYETADWGPAAGEEWQKVFGPSVPV